jgi:lipopolysaccharide transport system permease protein
MIKQLVQLRSSSGMMRAWTERTIRARYQQSILGWLWAIVQPVASVIVFSIIFTRFVPVNTGDIPYPVFSYVAIVPWTFLSNSLSDMTGSFVGNMSLVTKIYFPREVLPLSAMFARLIDFFVGYSLLIIMIFIYDVVIDIRVWLLLPIVIIIQIFLISGIGMLTASLNVFLRDIQPLLALVLQLWFYASPIIYPADLVPEYLRFVYYLNPMAGILESYRDILIRGDLPGNYLFISTIESLLIFIIGYWVYSRLQPLFADII